MEEIFYSQNNNSTISCYSMDFSGISKQNAHGGRNVMPRCLGVMFRSPRAFVGSTATLRYEPCTQFINVSQRALHIYWQFSAMSLVIHKIVSKRRCQSYFISRRSPHHGISKDSDLCASAHRCPHYAYARLIARVNSQFISGAYSPEPPPRIP